MPVNTVDSLFFANGVVIDDKWPFRTWPRCWASAYCAIGWTWTPGRRARTVFVDGVEPDNLELDGEEYLWVALPLANGLLVVDTATGERHMAFRSQTPAQLESAEEFTRRGESGTPRMELFTQASWGSGCRLHHRADPSALTGVRCI